jgi:hypothetical protein
MVNKVVHNGHDAHKTDRDEVRSILGNVPGYITHRPLTKGRITQQPSPERDKGNAFSINVFLASRENKKLATQTKLELIWCNG